MAKVSVTLSQNGGYPCEYPFQFAKENIHTTPNRDIFLRTFSVDLRPNLFFVNFAKRTLNYLPNLHTCKLVKDVNLACVRLNLQKKSSEICKPNDQFYQMNAQSVFLTFGPTSLPPNSSPPTTPSLCSSLKIKIH